MVLHLPFPAGFALIVLNLLASCFLWFRLDFKTEPSRPRRIVWRSIRGSKQLGSIVKHKLRGDLTVSRKGTGQIFAVLHLPYCASSRRWAIPDHPCRATLPGSNPSRRNQSRAHRFSSELRVNFTGYFR